MKYRHDIQVVLKLSAKNQLQLQVLSDHESVST
jgi:hypothetical protein